MIMITIMYIYIYIQRDVCIMILSMIEIHDNHICHNINTWPAGAGKSAAAAAQLREHWATRLRHYTCTL